MKIPAHTQQEDLERSAEQLYNRYYNIDVAYSSTPELYFEGHYDVDTGAESLISEPLPVRGLSNPNSNKQIDAIVLKKRVHKDFSDRVAIDVDAVLESGLSWMFSVYVAEVHPKDCQKLAEFIIDQVEKQRSK